ncbi:RimK family alpha-L-glutamate ligase [Pseudomethylobacillus aquaticus]|uniref:RimK family alpha-L-glutamate ligase n=1 Tax=Pseudomethylobacillus aquaticus TaxID=2676064 RepID=A0A3N0UY88_9PROT|nr:RimK family alpha-L-glutamate ligase [Pseudomethylobacillus aquaticus]ROH85352.1 RimK family alpha-L-glutamate ligase [Pseudomethylobacillus aquaticus]
MTRRIAIFTDEPGWHGQQLQQAFASRSVQALFVSLQQCAFALHQQQPEPMPWVQIPGFEQSLPDGVFVRGVSGGSLQQVIMRLDVLHALKLLGVPVYNDGRAIERTVDKAMTSLLLQLHALPSPPTWVCESRWQAAELLKAEHAAGHALVLKPLFGSQGKGVQRLLPGSALPVPMLPEVDGLYYLQRYIDSGAGRWHDYRVFVIGQRVLACMRRHGQDWVNNVAVGGRCELVEGDVELEALALAAARAVDIAYCGVDIIRDLHGQCHVLEVNSIPAWRGLQSVARQDIALALVDDFVAQLA